MKVVIEREDLEKLIGLYIKSKLKVEADLEDSTILIDGERLPLSHIVELRLSIKAEEK